ncbi:MAG: hypothetical protein KDI13_07260 [Alphaproteobacteria bacterium]|nr:hypothetical protein [Alphaproteobacteria bacterium]
MEKSHSRRSAAQPKHLHTQFSQTHNPLGFELPEGATLESPPESSLELPNKVIISAPPDSTEMIDLDAKKISEDDDTEIGLVGRAMIERIAFVRSSEKLDTAGEKKIIKAATMHLAEAGLKFLQNCIITPYPTKRFGGESGFRMTPGIADLIILNKIPKEPSGETDRWKNASLMSGAAFIFIVNPNEEESFLAAEDLNGNYKRSRSFVKTGSVFTDEDATIKVGTMMANPGTVMGLRFLHSMKNKSLPATSFIKEIFPDAQL